MKRHAFFALVALLSVTVLSPLGASASHVTLTMTVPPVMPWPDEGSGAVAIPAFGAVASSPNEKVAPIASLTKMMTVEVALQSLPITTGQSGPCVRVSSYEEAIYRNMVATGQSNVAIATGETLCEDQLLEGIFVHSAGDYAVILQRMTGTTLPAFVSEMNATAHSLGMEHTRYVDVTGINARSESTAADQITLVQLLMQNPLIAQIARLTSVWLPVAGIVTTYTPLLGTHDVVGIKSGFTSEAGGCDAMAVQDLVAGQPLTTYAVVLGQHEGDELTAAGEAALALVHAADAGVAVGVPISHHAA